MNATYTHIHADLVEACKTGDRNAQFRLYQLYAKAMFNVCIRILGDRRIGIADFAGNRQYISIGNLAENDRVSLFLMDYPNRQRIKIWGRARIVDDDPALMEKLIVPDYRARPERALVIDIDAWDINCPQHITPRHDETTLALVTDKLTARIRALEAENAELKSWLGNRS